VTLCATNCGTSDVSLWVIMCSLDLDLELDTVVVDGSLSLSQSGSGSVSQSVFCLGLEALPARYVSSSSNHVQLLAGVAFN